MLEFQKPGFVSQSNAYVHICVLPISDIRILASCRPCLQRQHDAKLLGSEIVIYFFHVLYIDMVIGHIQGVRPKTILSEILCLQILMKNCTTFDRFGPRQIILDTSESFGPFLIL